MAHKERKPLLSKAHLTNLNLNNFKIIEAMGLKIYCIEVPLNDITSFSNFMKSTKRFKIISGGLTDRQTDRQTGD
jgi:hypothetical protein